MSMQTSALREYLPSDDLPPFDELPTALQVPQWICRQGKVPHNGRTKINAHNPDNWMSYNDALALCDQQGMDGVGYVFNGSGIVGIDLDHVFDEQGQFISNDARDLVATIQDSYIERSPSGSGLHVFIRGNLPAGLNHRIELDNGASVEVYDHARYFTFTGNAYSGSEIEHEADTMAAIIHLFEDQLQKAKPATVPSAQSTKTPSTSIDELEHLLSGIAHDDSYNQWFLVGAAIHFETQGSDQGYQLFDQWSSRGAKYNGLSDTRQQWKGYKLNRGKATDKTYLYSISTAKPRKRDHSGQQSTVRPFVPPTRMKRPKTVTSVEMLDGVYPRGYVSMLTADGGIGKTRFILSQMASLAGGYAMLTDRKTKPLTSMFISYDDDDLVWDILRRLEGIGAQCDYDRLQVYSMLDNPLPLHNGSDETPLFQWLRSQVKENKPDLVVIDHATSAFHGDHNDQKQVNAFMSALGAMTKATNTAIVLLGHVDKAGIRKGTNGASFTGSMAWNNKARSRVALSKAKGGQLVVTHEKTNYTAPLAKQCIDWINGVPAKTRLLSWISEGKTINVNAPANGGIPWTANR